MIRAVIVDDEANHHDILKRNLSVYCPEVKIVAELFTGEQCLQQLPSMLFDILLLDIELGDMNSFEMLQKMPFTDLHIIFVTSFDKYALEAFRIHAVDYLLKPIDGKALRVAMDRAMLQILSKERRMDLIAEYSMRKNNRIIVPVANEYKLIEIENILYCKSDGNYTDIIYHDGKATERKITDTHHLKHYEEKLKAYGFIRIHQSYLVNKQYVTRIRKNPSEIILSNGSELPIARERKQIIIEYFSGQN